MAVRGSVRLGPLSLSAPVTGGLVGVLALCCCGAGLVGLFGDSDDPPDRTSVVSTPTTRPAVVATPKASPKPAATSKKPPPPKNDPRFDTCAEANANGYGPYREGKDPEYEWYRDRDGDGIVCEPA